MKKLKELLKLFLTFFKIGLFTFGGGYAMISVMERELVDKKAWLNKNEFLDMTAIAESTPGPVAINSATYIGYKRSKVLGSIFATLGVVLPSFVIIYCISLFFEQFISLKYVSYAFKGIEACVAFIILNAGIKLFLGLNKSAFNIVMCSLSLICLTTFTILAFRFSTIYFILIGAVIGIVFYLISYIKSKKEKDKKGENKC